MAGLSKQRAHRPEAVRLSQEAARALQPYHDDLAETSPTFDGIVYFAKDHWHTNNASAVATVQPESADTERFAFYKQNIEFRRVDLGATALGLGLGLDRPQFLRSRMNPTRHTTLAHRAIINDQLVGGLQAAYNHGYGKVPTSTRETDKIWDKHEATVLEIADAFEQFSTKITSVGDSLELLAPATPNGIIASWDTRNSSDLADQHYGALRNYLLDTKRIFSGYTTPYNTYVHDTGDGQDITFFLPETSATFDRAAAYDVGAFGKGHILPLVQRLIEVNARLGDEYQDIEPRINFAIGIGYVEHDLYDGRTSQEYWKNAGVLKTHPSSQLSFTQHAHDTLFPKAA